jgi:RNA polymerase sigma-70 factor (ECF subfamily)
MNAASVGLISAKVHGKGRSVPNLEDASGKQFDFSDIATHADHAYLTALRITRSSSLAEDAVQEAYALFLRRPPQYRGAETMRNCFLATVQNCARNLLRGERRRKQREDLHSALAPKFANETEKNAADDELALAARSALDSLPLDERLSISLCCEQGLTLQAASEIVGVNKATLSRRINRGLEKLRKILAQQGYESSTPAIVGAALSALPLPAVPATLTTALQNLAENPALAAAKAAKLSAKALSRAAAKKTAATWWAFGLVAGAMVLAGGIWYVSNQPQAAVAVHQTETVAQTPVETPKERKEASEKTDRFYHRWTFDQGVPEDLEFDEKQNWTWCKPDKDFNRGGIMSMTGKDALVKLPLQFPNENTMVRVKAKAVRNFFGNLCLVSNGPLPPHSFWHDVYQRTETRENIVYESYYLDRRWDITLINGKPTNILRYDVENLPFDGQRMGLRVKNVVVEEIEVRTIKKEEIPESIRDPENLIAKRGIRLRKALETKTTERSAIQE